MLPSDVKKRLTSISEDMMGLAKCLPDTLKKLEDPQRLILPVFFLFFFFYQFCLFLLHFPIYIELLFIKVDS